MTKKLWIQRISRRSKESGKKGVTQAELIRRGAWELHRRRAKSRSMSPVSYRQGYHATLSVNPFPLDDRIERRYLSVIHRRGGEITIEEKDDSHYLSTTSKSRGMRVLHAEGWRYYSCRFGSRRASLSYLCGVDDSGFWAVRIPGTIMGVNEAQEWVTPAAVRKAKEKGKQVIRQGDVYLVQSKWDNVDELQGTRHEWDAEHRLLVHPEHVALPVSFPFRVYRQRVYSMGRGAGRSCGD